MEAHAMQYSQSYRAKKGYSFWEKDFTAMGCKTMLKQLLSKWGIMSTELFQAIDADEAVINEDGSMNYVETEEIIEAQTTPAPEPAKAEAPAEDPAAALFGGK